MEGIVPEKLPVPRFTPIIVSTSFLSGTGQCRRGEERDRDKRNRQIPRDDEDPRGGEGGAGQEEEQEQVAS